jgi:hypothetical protein
MRKLFYLINLFVLSSLTFNTSGQIDKSNRLEISVGGGLSLPIGSYGKKNPSKSAIYVANAPLPTVKGFDKSKSGFAKTGFDYNIEVKYKLSSCLKLLLLSGTYSNPVETAGMSDFLTNLNGYRETKVEENSYRIFYITPGIGYYSSLNKLNFGLDLFMGYSMTAFPYYKFVLLYTTVDPPIIFAHDGPEPNLNAFILGSSLSATYNLTDRSKVGIVVSYQGANFSYHVSPRSIPGGDAVYDYTNILKVRVINTGVMLGFNF